MIFDLSHHRTPPLTLMMMRIEETPLSIGQLEYINHTISNPVFDLWSLIFNLYSLRLWLSHGHWEKTKWDDNDNKFKWSQLLLNWSLISILFHPPLFPLVPYSVPLLIPNSSTHRISPSIAVKWISYRSLLPQTTPLYFFICDLHIS